MCPAAVRSRVLLSLPIQLTNYLQMPPHSEEATQAIRARQELQSCLGVYSTALFCTGRLHANGVALTVCPLDRLNIALCKQTEALSNRCASLAATDCIELAVLLQACNRLH